MLVILYWGLCNPKPRTKYSFFFIAKKMRKPVLSESACVEQDEQDNTTIAPFQIFDLSGAKMQKTFIFNDIG